MQAIEIALLVGGAAVFAASFFLPDKKKKEDMEGVSVEEIRRILDEEVAISRDRIEGETEQTLNYAIEKAERSLDKITNEKMLAVGEYSDTVMTQINQNHQSSVFLSDMLNKSKDELTDLLNRADAASKDASVRANEAYDLAGEAQKLAGEAYERSENAMGRAQLAEERMLDARKKLDESRAEERAFGFVGESNSSGIVSEQARTLMERQSEAERMVSEEMEKTGASVEAFFREEVSNEAEPEMTEMFYEETPEQEGACEAVIPEETAGQEPVYEEAVVEEAVAEEPVYEEAIVEEAVAEEPVYEEAVVEEAVAEEPVYEEAFVEETVEEEPVYEETVVEEAVEAETVTEEKQEEVSEEVPSMEAVPVVDTIPVAEAVQEPEVMAAPEVTTAPEVTVEPKASSKPRKKKGKAHHMTAMERIMALRARAESGSKEELENFFHMDDEEEEDFEETGSGESGVIGEFADLTEQDAMEALLGKPEEIPGTDEEKDSQFIVGEHVIIASQGAKDEKGHKELERMLGNYTESITEEEQPETTHDGMEDHAGQNPDEGLEDNAEQAAEDDSIETIKELMRLREEQEETSAQTGEPADAAVTEEAAVTTDAAVNAETLEAEDAVVTAESLAAEEEESAAAIEALLGNFQFEEEAPVRQAAPLRKEPSVNRGVAGDTGNNNERILEMYHQGRSKMAIAKALGVGLGEVQLVIDLFGNS